MIHRLEQTEDLIHQAKQENKTEDEGFFPLSSVFL